MKKTTAAILCILVFSTASFAHSQIGLSPDLMVTNIEVVQNMNNNTTAVTATIKNQGTARTGSGFDVKITASDAGIGMAPHNVSGIDSCPALPAQGICLATVIFTGTHWYNYYANADINNDVSESNENNNTSGWCAWTHVVDFNQDFVNDLYVGNITTYPAAIELVVDYVSPGMTVTLDTTQVYLQPEEITQVLMTVEFEPGFTGGHVVIVGVYDDGYTESPATIEFAGFS